MAISVAGSAGYSWPTPSAIIAITTPRGRVAGALQGIPGPGRRPLGPSKILGPDSIRLARATWPVVDQSDSLFRAQLMRWLERVNELLSAGDLRRLRLSVERGRPYGDDSWKKATAQRLGLESTLRSRGRPRKREE
jgi:hypothetical protein